MVCIPSEECPPDSPRVARVSFWFSVVCASVVAWGVATLHFRSVPQSQQSVADKLYDEAVRGLPAGATDARPLGGQHDKGGWLSFVLAEQSGQSGHPVRYLVWYGKTYYDMPLSFSITRMGDP